MNCLNCGANVSDHDKTCSYCGTENLKYYPPDDKVNMLLEKAMEAFNNKHYADSIKYYNQAIAIDPDLFNAYFYLAACYTSLNDPQKAINYMQKAQIIRPGNAAIYYNLGILCKQVGNKDEARNYLEKALAISKTDSTVNGKEFKQLVDKQLAEYKRWKFF